MQQEYTRVTAHNYGSLTLDLAKFCKVKNFLRRIFKVSVLLPHEILYEDVIYKYNRNT